MAGRLARYASRMARLIEEYDTDKSSGGTVTPATGSSRRPVSV
jgi:hypothetical protein